MVYVGSRVRASDIRVDNPGIPIRGRKKPIRNARLGSPLFVEMLTVKEK